MRRAQQRRHKAYLVEDERDDVLERIARVNAQLKQLLHQPVELLGRDLVEHAAAQAKKRQRASCLACFRPGWPPAGARKPRTPSRCAAADPSRQPGRHASTGWRLARSQPQLRQPAAACGPPCLRPWSCCCARCRVCRRRRRRRRHHLRRCRTAEGEAKTLSRQARAKGVPLLRHAPRAAAQLRCATASRGRPPAAWRSATRRACDRKASCQEAGRRVSSPTPRTAPPASRTRCRCCPAAARHPSAPAPPARRCSAAKQQFLFVSTSLWARARRDAPP